MKHTHKFETPADRRLYVLLRTERVLARSFGAYGPHNICTAVHFAAGHGFRPERIDICRWINHLLYPHAYYHSWLSRNHGIRMPDEPGQQRAYDDQLQRSRHAWLRWMIEETRKEMR